MAAGGSSGGAAPPPSQPPLSHSPPKAEVDDSPLQNAMDKNKESLRVKLMVRRPINQLVAQGIMPPLKTPPHFHEQRQKLERAKKGDLLKAKIQQRPNRQELVRQHILADLGHLDPSLAEKQLMLKKCKLADQLNDQLSHRPGPLELIKKNILHTEEPIERAVKEGQIEFKATCEGQKTKPQHPDHYMIGDDDSLSSEATSPPEAFSSPSTEILQQPSPQHLFIDSHLFKAERSIDSFPDTSVNSRDVIGTAATQAGIVTVIVPSNLLTAASSPSSISSSISSSLSPLSSINSPPSARPAPPPGKEKYNRKKPKSKMQVKPKQIKFHEYKGPPNAHKNSSLNSSSNSETSYELLLQQQQLFLQWQLEWQRKYPLLLPASQKPQEQQTTANLIAVTSKAPPAPPLPPVQPPPPPPPPEPRPLRNLEDMKVCDLKAELKKRNLPVSGPKPQLIERLKSCAASIRINNSNNHNSSSNVNNNVIPISDDSLLSVCNVSPPQCSMSEPESPPSSAPQQPMTPVPSSTPSSPAPSPMVSMETDVSEEIIREQKKKIDELQNQLCHYRKQNQQTTFQTMPNAKASLAAFIQQQKLNNLLLQHQQIQQQQQLHQQQTPLIIHHKSPETSPETFSPDSPPDVHLQQQQIELQQNDQHQMNVQQEQPQIADLQFTLTVNNNINNCNNNNLINDGKMFINNNNNNGNYKHVVLGQQQAAAIILNNHNKTNGYTRGITLPNFIGAFVNGVTADMIPKSEPDDLVSHNAILDDIKPPPYEDATKLLKVKTEPEDGVKSQTVNDLLEILIKNGELPPSVIEDTIPKNTQSSVMPEIRTTYSPIAFQDVLDDVVEPFDNIESMDFTSGVSQDDPVSMDMDHSWLDSFIDSTSQNLTSAASTSHDPLLAQELYFMDDSDFGWDAIGYPT